MGITCAFREAHMIHLAALALAVTTADTLPPARLDSVPLRPMATASVDYSDAYYTRLTVHRVASYTMLPLFAAEYFLGDRLLNGAREESWIKPTHVGVGMGIGGLFAVNTVTGLWNLWDARHDPNG